VLQVTKQRTWNWAQCGQFQQTRTLGLYLAVWSISTAYLSTNLSQCCCCSGQCSEVNGFDCDSLPENEVSSCSRCHSIRKGSWPVSDCTCSHRPWPWFHYSVRTVHDDNLTWPFSYLFVAAGSEVGANWWASARRELLDYMVQGKVNRGRHTDHPAGRHSIWTNQCSPPPSPHFLQAGCPSCRPTNSVKARKATSFSPNTTAKIASHDQNSHYQFHSMHAMRSDNECRSANHVTSVAWILSHSSQVMRQCTSYHSVQRTPAVQEWWQVAAVMQGAD